VTPAEPDTDPDTDDTEPDADEDDIVHPFVDGESPDDSDEPDQDERTWADYPGLRAAQW
jgi:hypothetical protein